MKNFQVATMLGFNILGTSDVTNVAFIIAGQYDFELNTCPRIPLAR